VKRPRAIDAADLDRRLRAPLDAEPSAPVLHRRDVGKENPQQFARSATGMADELGVARLEVEPAGVPQTAPLVPVHGIGRLHSRSVPGPTLFCIRGGSHKGCGKAERRAATSADDGRDDVRPFPRMSEAPALAVADVVLRDGSTMRLRPPQAEDGPALLRFFEDLSDRSLYLRFHGHPHVGEQLVTAVLDPDWTERGALVGTHEGAIVALAQYVRLRDRRSAEAAFAVADAFQGRGVGSRLLEELAAAASGAGVEEFVAEVMPGNTPMLRVFADAGFAQTRAVEAGVVEVRLALAPTQALLVQVDERDHVAVAASLQRFFDPQTVAVIGASPRRGTIGGELFRNVLRADFAGAVYPVNRNADSVAGVRGYSSAREIDADIDLAVVCVPGPAVLAAAEDALGAGVRSLCVISAGFAEVGAEGAERQQQLLELVRSYGGRLIGPNCLGIAVSGPRLNATFGPRALPPGNVGVSSQSGALGLALLERAAGRDLGLSAFVSIGNKADVSSNDLLEYWEEDPATDVVLLYLESFGNPRKFARVARRVAARKPIVALKAGRTSAGAQAASSHTAALAGSEAAVDALFRQAGVLRVDTLEELLDVTALLSQQPLPAGRRVGILTNAGGLGILCADACEAAGLELPQLTAATRDALREVLPAEASVLNPVDLLGSAVGRTYEQVVPIVLADEAVDAVIALFVPPVQAGAAEVAEAIARGLERTTTEKPVLACIVSEGGLPAALRGRVAGFGYPESAARALGRAAERAAWLRRPVGRLVEPDVDRAAAAAVASGPERWLTADEMRALFVAYEIPFVGERMVESVDGAVQAAEELGLPAVVKTAVAGAHKTELGGVALDLRELGAVREAAERIGPPLVVQQFVRSGVELLAGVVQDPTFGPLVAFGVGGTLAELVGDTGYALAPVTDIDATELVTTGKAGRLVDGYRGAAPADAAALIDLVQRLGRLAEDVPAIAELDLNPVLATADGCVAVDARVRVAPPPERRQTKRW
jgi:acetate---CoA ligase (ADP-forming)